MPAKDLMINCVYDGERILPVNYNNLRPPIRLFSLTC